jgi:hypothetical protein
MEIQKKIYQAHSKTNRALNHAEIQYMLQFLKFKERMNICRVCKLWKNVIEKTKIEYPVRMNEFTNISMESAAKICPLVRGIAILENFPNKLKQGRMFPKFTGVKKLLLLAGCTKYDNHSSAAVSKLICKSAKTLELISVNNVDPCASFVMGTIFPKLQHFYLQTELNDIEFLKQFLNLIPEMFPNLYLFDFFPYKLQQRAQNQETRDFLNWVRNLKFSSLPKLQIALDRYVAE